MTITPIEFEKGRFHVQSQSRSDVMHTVDLSDVKAEKFCSCESSLAHGNKYCVHVQAVIAYERKRLGL